MAARTVKVCVGSSCHIKGARELIMELDRLVRERHLESEVELSGSFCMERCGEGLNWEIDGEPVSSPTVEDAVSTFRKEVLEPLSGDANE